MEKGGNTRRCQGITPSGKRCERIVGASQTHCFAHDPSKAQARSENAAKAARSKRGSPSEEIVELREQLRGVAEDVRGGKVTTAKGSVIAQILGVLLRTFEQQRKQAEFDEIRGELAELKELVDARQRGNRYE